MKYLIIVLFITALGSIITGYFIDAVYAKKLIGFGVLGIFFVIFPLFSYYRWKNKNIQDYMLTKENLDKMKDFKQKNIKQP